MLLSSQYNFQHSVFYFCLEKIENETHTIIWTTDLSDFFNEMSWSNTSFSFYNIYRTVLLCCIIFEVIAEIPRNGKMNHLIVFFQEQ